MARDAVSPALARPVAILSSLAVALSLAGAASAAPQDRAISLRDSFRIGSSGVPCTAQIAPPGSDAPGMFDRAYGVTCRDAASSVGRLYALRLTTDRGLDRYLADRADRFDCTAPTGDLASGTIIDCTRRSDRAPWRIRAQRRDQTLFVAEGLRGYDGVLDLGLRTLVADQPVEGAVDVATIDAQDSTVFARTQATSADRRAALNEGYARNNAGNFADAAAFFAALAESSRGGDANSLESLLNSGLQSSNLGDAPAAERAFALAERRGAGRDPILARMLRNYRVIALLNQRKRIQALALTARALPPVDPETDADLARGVINPATADRINRADAGVRRLSSIDAELRPYERAQLLDAQNDLLKGVSLRLLGRPAEALPAFDQAITRVQAVRGGRVASAAFLQAEALAESALTREAQRDYAGAEADFAEGVRLIDANYPLSATGLTARARLAAYKARRGDAAGATALFEQVVAASADVEGGASALRNLLAPYFALLAQTGDDPVSARRMFDAAQVLTRPGLAQTQAVLARELSAGDDDAAKLFRASLNRSRDIERATAALVDLQDAGSAQDIAAAQGQLDELRSEQTALQAQLGDYPRYRALTARGLTLADLQSRLRPGEAYYLMRVVGREVYALFITAGDARAFKLGADATRLGQQVAAMRDGIVRIDHNRFVTSPFDVDAARSLYLELFGPVADRMGSVAHLIYEPDGPMLPLPANLLIVDQASVDAYHVRTRGGDADWYDMRGVAWLGRDRDVTTSVSPRAFVDVRDAPASRARLPYLGMGSNAKPALISSFLAPKPADVVRDRCEWPLSAWNNPISDAELLAARNAFGGGGQVIEGAAFSDTAIKARQDLSDYRIVHFATHGLVTAPRPDCVARPALLTSFGGQGSDGLLSFREIFDLRLDADLVVLSACDTAGMATVQATREAGVSTGGAYALDGLVRAFVGAGARTVVASHWPVPDDDQATERLILGMLTAPPGTPVAGALRQAQRGLMDDAATSHPYYWSAFAVVGDGERPISAAR